MIDEIKKEIIEDKRLRKEIDDKIQDVKTLQILK